LNFTYRLYSFQTRLFCIIVLEVRSSVSTIWLLRGPILLKSLLYDVNVKVLMLKFMSHILVPELIWLRVYMILILMSNCKVWIVAVASKSFYFCWIFCLIRVIVLWDFQSEETIEAFDMIVEDDDVLLVINIDDYPQKLNEIVETWCIWI
jgi:hypothetical protein